MAVVEFQIRKDAFLEFVKREINSLRLPVPSLNAPILGAAAGKRLEQIECVACTMEPSIGEQLVTVQAQLAIHYHPSDATIRAAGSLKRPVTARHDMTLPLTIAVAFVPGPPGTAAVVQIRWTALSGLLSGVFPISPAGITLVAGAIEASAELVSIRFGTQGGDVVSGPVTNRLGNHQWARYLSGALIAEQLTTTLATALQTSLPKDLKLTRAASGSWVPFSLPGKSAPAFALAGAGITAPDQCLFDIDIDVDISLSLELAPVGAALTSTLTVQWDADSTLCDVVGTLLLTPIGGIAIHVIAEDEAADTILGITATPDRFVKIGNSDDEIWYESKSVITGPAPQFVVTDSEVTVEGLVSRGPLQLQALPRGLEGEAYAARSELDRDCQRKSVTVQFRPAEVYLRDIGRPGGAPRLLGAGSVLLDPPNAWAVASVAANTWLDLRLVFNDPPTGRLPAGTATSAILVTDCGTRWVDLGVVPADHAAPSMADMAQMLSQCMVVGHAWIDGRMKLEWLIDPPHLHYDIEPVRQWTVGAHGLPPGTRLELTAVDREGAERALGVARGRANIAIQVITRADEVLRIDAGDRIRAPSPVVQQRWLVPLASLRLDHSVRALAATGNLVAMHDRDGAVHVVSIGDDRRLESVAPERLRAAGTSPLLWKLEREARRTATSFASATRLDRDTVAFVSDGQLFIGRAGPQVRM